MDAERTALEGLARLARVATSYEDARGVEQHAPPDAIRSVLGTLGFASTDDAAVERATKTLVERPWTRMLEPVYVLDADVAGTIAVTLAAADDSAALAWELVGENGETTRGETRLAASAVVASVTIDGIDYVRRALVIPPRPLGYDRLTVRCGDASGTATVVHAPARCWLPATARDRGVWGLAIQLYGIRSARNWGIGDFTDLATIGAIVADAGGSLVGLNPLHAVRVESTGTPSPYSPSTRLFSNWLYLDVERMPGFDPADVDRASLAIASASADVDYATVARVKSACTRLAYDRFRASGDARAFDAYVAAAGEPLQRVATFEALAADAERRGETADWQTWRPSFRDAASADVAAFAREHASDVAYYAYLQWQIDEQLEACARSSGLAIGLYRDLAVGADVAGSETWSFAGTMTRDATVGAPPDILNTRGQNWGVAPFDPLRLREAAYAPFAALLRANMRHAGALRIDHVMALARLYWIPRDSPATLGAFVGYELDELLGIVALESVRNRCMVIGEDLGTVPAGFREALEARGVLSYRLLQFEVDDDGFVPPQAYPQLALTSTGTHDLPPVGAYWTASDIDVRSGLGFFSDDAATEARERADRERRREQLLVAFERALGFDASHAARFRAAVADRTDRATLAELALAANRYLAQSPAALLLVQLEDLLGETDQVNVPTTLDEHPNWRRRTSVDLENLASDGRFTALAEALRDAGRARERIARHDSE